MRNGVSESKEDKTASQRWNELNNILDEYEKSIQLKLKINNDIEEVLNLSRAELQSASAEECGENSYLLAQYAAYIQKEYNRHSAKYKWATQVSEIYIAKRAKEYGDKYTKFEEKCARVLENDSYAQSLINLKIKAETRMEDLSFLATRINTMGSMLEELQKTKRSKRWNNSE